MRIYTSEKTYIKSKKAELYMFIHDYLYNKFTITRYILQHIQGLCYPNEMLKRIYLNIH